MEYEARYVACDESLYPKLPDKWFNDLEEAEGYARHTSTTTREVICLYDLEEPGAKERTSSFAVYAYGTRYGRDGARYSDNIEVAS